MNTILVLLAIVSSIAWRATTAFSVQKLPCIHSELSRRYAGSYGKGAEIWPEPNAPISTLADSFPNGQTPTIAKNLLSVPTEEETSEEDMALPQRTTGRKRRIVKKVSKILRGAAGLEATQAASETESDPGFPNPAATGFDGSPAIVAAVLLGLGVLSISDLLFTVSFSGYLVILYRYNSLGGAEGRPLVLALPPQGHVPALVSNPLGSFTKSSKYRFWLEVGAVLGLFLPAVGVGWYRFWKKDVASACAVASPLFLICVQALTEAVCRRVMAPLPLRILVPITYNAKRLSSIWNWACMSSPLGVVGRTLAITNFIYWALNLFVFLLPIATMRYMRAHFWCVEAEEVVLREGRDEDVGMIGEIR